MPETERQKTERLLREQLARIEKAEFGGRSPHVVFASAPAGTTSADGWPILRLTINQWRRQAGEFLGDLFSKPRSLQRIETWSAAAFRRLTSLRLPGRKPDQLAELQARLDGLRSEQPYEQPSETTGKPAFGGPVRQARPAFPAFAAAGDYSRSRDLPNGSDGGPRVAAMKDAPAQNWGPPPAVQFPRPEKKKDRRSDLVIAALGVVLGLTCALFPWYIFFNQEQFGVQAIALGGRGHNAGRIMIDPRTGDELADAAAQTMKKNLDLFSTGTVQTKPETPENAPGLEDQPFPSEAAEFRLVHVANGRAMIEDDAGLWVVQQGATLPDSTRVKSIEKRNGRWVLVTSADRVVELSK